MQKRDKLTKEQKKAYKSEMQKFQDDVEAMEAQDAIEPQTLKKAPEQLLVCTPEIKLKASTPIFDLELTPEQTKGGFIRIVRVGSNKIKICSIVNSKDLDDGYAEKRDAYKKDQAEKAKEIIKERKSQEGKDEKASLVSKNKNKKR